MTFVFFNGGVLLVPTLVLPNTAALSDSGIFAASLVRCECGQLPLFLPPAPVALIMFTRLGLEPRPVDRSVVLRPKPTTAVVGETLTTAPFFRASQTLPTPVRGNIPMGNSTSRPTRALCKARFFRRKNQSVRHRGELPLYEMLKVQQKDEDAREV